MRVHPLSLSFLCSVFALPIGCFVSIDGMARSVVGVLLLDMCPGYLEIISRLGRVVCLPGNGSGIAGRWVCSFVAQVFTFLEFVPCLGTLLCITANLCIAVRFEVRPSHVHHGWLVYPWSAVVEFRAIDRRCVCAATLASRFPTLY